MDLYILGNTAKKKKILVLDNGLAIYHTTIEDVCMRKSPSVKEMISIRNTIKILNDEDVILGKKGGFRSNGSGGRHQRARPGLHRSGY